MHRRHGLLRRFPAVIIIKSFRTNRSRVESNTKCRAQPYTSGSIVRAEILPIAVAYEMLYGPRHCIASQRFCVLDFIHKNLEAICTAATTTSTCTDRTR